jgi:pilus assembly protein CpaF
MSRLQRGLTGLSSISRHGTQGNTSLGGQDRQASNKSFEELKRHIHNKLIEKLDLSRVSDLAGDTLRREIRLVVERLCDTENPLLNRMERERLIDEVLDETFGFGPLEVLLKDPTVSDILINGPQTIFVERRGKLEKTESTASSPRSAGASMRPRRWWTPACRTAPVSTPSSRPWPWTARR